MSFSFLPVIRADSLTQLTAAALQQRGIQLLMMDFDNTIVPYTTSVPTEEMLAWIDQMNQSDLKLCVVSNSRNSRVPEFCKAYGLDCITHAKKPFSKGIKACLARYGMEACHSALVGDQIYTDVLGANCAGVTSILIPAIHNHNIWLKLRHVAELPFVFATRNRRISSEKSE